MMYWYGRPRAGGKTTEMILEAAGRWCGSRLVVHSKMEADRVYQLALDSGHDIAYPLTYDEFLRGEYYGERIEEFVIDNVDMLLRYISKNVRIRAVSFDTSSCRMNIKSPVPLNYEVDDENPFQKEIECSWRVRKDGD